MATACGAAADGAALLQGWPARRARQLLARQATEGRLRAAHGRIVTLEQELKGSRDALAMLLGGGKAEVLQRAEFVLNVLGKLLEGDSPTHLEQLQRNVALHAAEWPGYKAPATAWRRAQRGPRLGRCGPRRAADGAHGLRGAECEADAARETGSAKHVSASTAADDISLVFCQKNEDVPDIGAAMQACIKGTGSAKRLSATTSAAGAAAKVARGKYIHAQLGPLAGNCVHTKCILEVHTAMQVSYQVNECVPEGDAAQQAEGGSPECDGLLGAKSHPRELAAPPCEARKKKKREVERVLASALVRNGSVTTTYAGVVALRGLVARTVVLAKRGNDGDGLSGSAWGDWALFTNSAVCAFRRLEAPVTQVPSDAELATEISQIPRGCSLAKPSLKRVRAELEWRFRLRHGKLKEPIVAAVQPPPH